MRKSISIGEPYIIDLEEKTRLCADLLFDDGKNISNKVMYFEVDYHYKKFLCSERADCFIIASLQWAMHNDYDIYSKAPMSSDIFFKVNNYLIPTLSKNTESLNMIDIKTTLVFDRLNTGNAVGTGFSLGVDSFYELLRQRENIVKEYELTHVTLFNVGGNLFTGKDGEKLNENFQDYVDKVKPIASH